MVFCCENQSPVIDINITPLDVRIVHILCCIEQTPVFDICYNVYFKSAAIQVCHSKCDFHFSSYLQKKLFIINILLHSSVKSS